jgi:hypothetical protein
VWGTEGHEKQIVDQEVPRDPLSLKQVVQVIFNKIGQEAIQKLLYPRDRIIGLHIVKMLSIFNDQTEISNIISPTIQIDEDFSEEHRYDLLELIYCVEQLFCTYSKENFLSTFGNLQLAKKSFTIAAKEGTEPSTFYIAPSCLIPKEAN